MKTPVNKTTLKQHFTYYWWLYILIAALSVLGIGLLYTVTAPRVPDNKKVNLIVYGYTNPELLDAYLESVHTAEFPDMEQISQEQIIPDDVNGLSTLAAKFYAQEGDLYILPRDTFLNYSEDGVLLPLEDDMELLAVLGNDVDYTRGVQTLTRTNEQHLFGIPLDQLPGLEPFVYAERGFLCVAAGSTNPENGLKFLRIICRDMKSPPANEPASEATSEVSEPSSEPASEP